MQPKSVRFVDQIQLIPGGSKVQDDDELTLKWYSEQEQGQLKRLFLQDIQEAWRMLATTPIALIDQEDVLISFVGMEASLSPQVMRSRRQGNINHVRTILSAARHIQARPGGARDLALLSAHSSMRARARSHIVATKYWNM